MIGYLQELLSRTPPDPVRLPLTNSHGTVLAILISYLLLVKVVGPKLMESRKPFDLRGVIKVYNIVQIIYNVILCACSAFLMLGPGNYNFNCIENLPLDHEWKNFERWTSYAYYFNKYMDLLETFFFVLRKKNQQISFLHVFHHVIMVFLCYWYLFQYGYGGHGFFMISLNVVVHIMMYAYYYQSSLNPSVRANLWWKKYMTIIQLVQFGIVLSHSTYILRRGECTALTTTARAGTIFSTIFIILFLNFYIRAYVLPKKKVVQKTSK
ncbi:elongation of very long chain fatty acids protein F-like [Drosophila ficusphila]|uniref:elongation of very long chain fatty acids protein F-like n=1 Tax=Drosophila ficusphila TaxID=30025 RepID=UPI0007E775B5|nr:elongation of very long chain fatty acids protein F-like [Drosophila ficusphila]